jgi:Holliday junction resolvase
LTNYETGRRLEYRVRDIFRKSGFFVIRAAQSKPIDLVCLRKGESVLVECKAGSSYLSDVRRKELVALGERTGATVVLARRKHRTVELTNLDNGERFEPDGTPNSMSH